MPSPSESLPKNRGFAKEPTTGLLSISSSDRLRFPRDGVLYFVCVFGTATSAGTPYRTIPPSGRHFKNCGTRPTASPAHP
jgi:hypothetical protein